MSLVLLFLYLMLNMFQMLIHPSSRACDIFVELFHGLYCSGSICIGVTLWFGCGGVVSVCRLKHFSAFRLEPVFETQEKLLNILLYLSSKQKVISHKELVLYLRV